jgi:transmembrane sensor
MICAIRCRLPPPFLFFFKLKIFFYGEREIVFFSAHISMTRVELQEIMVRYTDGSASDAEAQLMEAYYAYMGTRLAVNGITKEIDEQQFLEHEAKTLTTILNLKQEREQTILANHPAHRIHFLKSAWVRYAAAILIILGIGAYLWNTQHKKTSASTAGASSKAVKHDVAPGSNHAILTLSDGRKVELTSEAKRITETGISIANDSGKLEYGKADRVVFNTMSTPRGGQYQLTLPDGTNVWLNAASSITYPTAFTASTREVTITGEAYFQVTKIPAKPFIVKTLKENITVLGTSFNVNAYAENTSVKTSLLEGSVKIAETILKSGQAYQNGEVVKTDIEQDIAWKNGYFSFENKSLEEIMNELSRWYDLDVSYEEGVPQKVYIGKMKRNLNLSQVLNGLKNLGLEFRVEANRRVIITR